MCQKLYLCMFLKFFLKQKFSTDPQGQNAVEIEFSYFYLHSVLSLRVSGKFLLQKKLQERPQLYTQNFLKLTCMWYIYSSYNLYMLINFGCMNSLDEGQIADYKNEPKTTDLKLTRLAFSSSILVNIAILLSFNLCI